MKPRLNDLAKPAQQVGRSLRTGQPSLKEVGMFFRAAASRQAQPVTF